MSVIGQEYIISGTITDKLTTEPIPFANVAFVGTGIGTVTDFNGKYTIRSKILPDTLTATFVGYDPVQIKVRRVQNQTINFVMTVNKVEINEVVIVAGENPADVIMRNVVDNKNNNNKDKLDSYQYEVYNKLELDITNITEDFKNKKFLRPFQFIFDNIDSTTTNDKPFLPFFISESISDYYFKNDPRNKREIIRGSKVSGLENETVTQFLGDMYQNVNIYDPYIELFNKGFVSPISGIGKLYYKFYLLDSAMIDQEQYYKIKFKPRRKGDLAFLGELWVHKGSWAVKEINMRVMEDVNINWINDLAIVQEFEQLNNDVWMMNKDRLVVDFEAREDGLGFIGRKSTTYRNIKVNQEAPPEVFVGTETIIVKDDASKKDVNFWTESRHEILSSREKKIYSMVDTIKSLPAFQTYVDIITLFITGHYEIGLVEIGPYYKMFSFNPVEGNRLRLGLRTSNKFSTRLQLGGYIAYGTKDE
ncbi:MAG: carboxypeptidase-like regulatory domain-containing protein, partial [Bacteroidia bacterium]|nr:carboxypeptidase-like regulatory domain-containing protein [Bacteroidia bacterium]